MEALFGTRDKELRCDSTAAWVLNPSGFSQHLSRLMESRTVHTSGEFFSGLRRELGLQSSKGASWSPGTLEGRL